MKTVGTLLKEARLKKRYSKLDLGELTKIKASFISAIERGDWKNLPEFGVVVGFVKSIAHFLDVDEREAVAFLRRDYPPSLITPSLKSGKQKEIGRRFFWSPRLTFLVGVGLILLIVLGYLGFQYRKFSFPPHLTIDSPKEGQVVTGSHLQVQGTTDADATLTVNNQPTVVDNTGHFSTQIDISEKTEDVEVVAKSRDGKETIIKRKIDVQP